jgi:uncharacterized protein (DUF697 family)
MSLRVAADYTGKFNRVPRIRRGVAGIKGSGSMRKRVVRAVIFLVIAIAGAMGAASAAGAFDSPMTTLGNTDEISWD